MMKLKKIFLTAILLLFLLQSIAQSIEIEGVVTDKATGEALYGVLVTINGSNKVIHYTQTSAEGTFKFNVKEFPENYSLHFSMLGFAETVVPLKSNRLIYNVSLAEKAINLREVIVKAPSIYERGDTISYVVSKFADVQDKSLASVLRKMPGIEVDNSGAIKYNGVAINKFYIEGKDMLGGRYGIATNNIHQKDVGSIEVMENHQPVKALENISFSQNPAINVRLKEDAKARWVGTVKAGIGLTPFLWNAETAMMRFKKKSQTLNTYKTNNIGVDIERETMLFSVDDIFSQFGKNYRLTDYVDIRASSLSDIDEQRVRFNKSHSFTTNNLWGLARNYDLSSQITYTNNRLTSDNSSQTFYFLPDSTVFTELSEHADSKKHHLIGDITLRANTEQLYLENKLLTDLYWDDINVNITGTYPNKQDANKVYRNFSNDLKIVKRFGEKAFRVNSYNLYQIKPQNLSVLRNNAKQYQEVENSAFFTNTNTALSYYIKPFTLSMKLGIIGVMRSMKSEIKGVSDTLGQLRNDLSMQYMNLYVSPEIEYKGIGFETRFSMPISYIPYHYRNNLSREELREDKFFLSPYLYLRYHFTPRLSTSFSGSYAQSPLHEQSFYEGLILNNYRNLSQGYINYETGNNKSTNLNIEYKNPLKTFFVNVGITCSWTYSPRISNLYFLKEYLLNNYISEHNNTNMWLLDGSVSKGLDAIDGIISLSSSFSNVEGRISQNGTGAIFTADNWSISSRITSRIAQWSNISYELNFSERWLKSENIKTDSAYKSISQKIKINLNPGKSWYFQLSGEHYYNEITKGIAKHFLLTDAELTYNFKGGWEFNLLIKNIFNQKEYAYNSYDGLMLMNREYTIRPCNVLASIFFRF